MPEDTSKAKKTRVLITAHDLNVHKACPLKTIRKEYCMRGISSVEATNILNMEMLNDTEVYKVNKINHIIQRCGGIPLMLKLVARALRVTVQTRS